MTAFEKQIGNLSRTSRPYHSKALATNFNFRLAKSYEHPALDKMHVALHHANYAEEAYAA